MPFTILHFARGAARRWPAPSLVPKCTSAAEALPVSVRRRVPLVTAIHRAAALLTAQLFFARLGALPRVPQP